MKLKTGVEIGLASVLAAAIGWLISDAAFTEGMRTMARETIDYAGRHPDQTMKELLEEAAKNS